MGKFHPPTPVVWRHRSSRESMQRRIRALRNALHAELEGVRRADAKQLRASLVCSQDERFTPSRRFEYAAQVQELTQGRRAERLEAAFERKVERLQTFGLPGTTVVVESLLPTQPRAFAVDSSSCLKCGSVVKFNQTNCQLICQYCGFCATSIFVTKDVSDDAVANKRYTKTSHTPTQRAPPKQDDVVGPKVAHFQQWLEQFTAAAPRTPAAVFDVLYRELSHVQVAASAKCRPTHVATVLKSYGFKEHLPAVNRIAMECNGYTTPNLDEPTRDRMVGRYREIVEVEARHNIPAKVYTFEFVCTLVFWAEARTEFLPTIFVQKARNVLKFGDDRVVTLLRALAATTQYEWSALAAAVGV